ncbi:MAG: Hsp20/alpha crystallin family protein [Bacteroidetes bacterium]|nr:Hsp20/alpha crystallin family protein [Bacteroidota bacterium]
MCKFENITPEILFNEVEIFSKKNIKLSIHGNVLSINAKKDDDVSGTVIWKQRPDIIDKKIKLPMRIKEGKEQVNSAKYAEGVLTITIPIENTEKNIPIQ